jgi:hypothetical protein
MKVFNFLHSFRNREGSAGFTYRQFINELTSNVWVGATGTFIGLFKIGGG